MIVHEILGNRAELSAERLAKLTEYRVLLDNEQLLKRVQRLTTASGREIGLQLANNQELHDGDMVHLDEDTLITVEAAPADELAMLPQDLKTMAFVPHSLGNRHPQAQFFAPESQNGRAAMVVRYDHTVEDFLIENEIP